jgi:choline transporter-like protein 2/4/5
VCGVDTGVADRKYIMYPRINEDFVNNYGKSPTDYSFYGLCVSSCPAFSAYPDFSKMPVVCSDAGDALGYSSVTGAGALASSARSCLSGNSAFCGAVPNVDTMCWLSTLPTASTMFRCIPSYGSVASTTSSCAFPVGLTATDVNCLMVNSTTNSFVTKPAKPNYLFDQLNTYQAAWSRYLGDLGRAWWVVLLCAVGVALVGGFVFTTFIKYFTGCMVWSLIWLTILLLSFLCGYFYYKAGLVSSYVTSSLSSALASIPGATSTVSTVSTAVSGSLSSTIPNSFISETTGPGSVYAIIAYTCTAVVIIVLCMTLALRTSIRTAIEVIRMGSEALKGTPSLLLFPVTTTITLGAFMVWWCFVAACLATAGDSMSSSALTSTLNAEAVKIATATGTTGSTPSMGANYNVTSFDSATGLKYVLIYHFFGLLWTSAFISGIALTTMAGAIGAWYFSQIPAGASEEVQKLKYEPGRFPVCAALNRTLRFYMGTVAVGSFLIALIQMIRAVMMYVTNSMKKAAESNNWLAFMLCCANCCLKCIDCCVQVITKNAYIFAAIKGDSFLSSGRRVFGLIMQHGTAFAVVNVLGVLIVTLGKVLIAVLSAFIAYLILDNYSAFQAGGKDQLSSTWLVILVVLFFGYATGAAFMSVFDIAVDTVLVCYVTDCDENKERGGEAAPVHFKKVRPGLSAFI